MTLGLEQRASSARGIRAAAGLHEGDDAELQVGHKVGQALGAHPSLTAVPLLQFVEQLLHQDMLSRRLPRDRAARWCWSEVMNKDSSLSSGFGVPENR